MELELVKSCERCSLRKKCNNVVVDNYQQKSKAMLICTSPSSSDDIMGEPLTGVEGEYLTKLLNLSGMERSDFYITNVVKCYTKEKISEKNIEDCKSWLWLELKSLQPCVIITMGLVPTRLLLKTKKSISLSKYVGLGFDVSYMKSSIYPWYDIKFLLNNGKELEEKTVNFLKKVKNEINNSIS